MTSVARQLSDTPEGWVDLQVSGHDGIDGFHGNKLFRWFTGRAVDKDLHFMVGNICRLALQHLPHRLSRDKAALDKKKRPFPGA